MLVKNDVLSEFKNVRSYERLDLLCSLLDLCLPYELRFLGTCLEFLGKRDFYELREDERDANNVNHISSFRSLMEENTRRKLVLYVSLLKSCNSDCANCLSETLTALSIGDVNQICRTEPENAEKLLDELLLLYTVAVKHPAFNVHQKIEFAEHLSRLKEEDHRLALILYPNDDDIAKTSRLFKPSDAIPETPCKPKDNPSENRDNSSQISVISQANQLTCHVLSGSVYTSAVLPAVLHQASATCLNPAHVMVSSVSAPVAQPSAEGLTPESATRLSGDSMSALGMTGSPVTTSVIVGPTLGSSPGPGMLMSLTPPNHCMMSASGDMGMQKNTVGHPNMMTPMMCVPPESMPMHYPGHAHFGMMVPFVGHIPGPPLQGTVPHTPVSKPVTSSVPPAPVPSPVPTLKSVSSSCPSYSLPSSSPPAAASSCSPSTSGAPFISTKESSSKPEDGERQSSGPSSPASSRATTPPGSASKFQGFNSKGVPHQFCNQSVHPTANLMSQTPSSTHQTYQIPSNVYPNSEAPPPQLVTQLPPANPNAAAMNQVHYPNQIMPVAYPQCQYQVMQQMSSKPPGQWTAPGDNLKEVIVREMPKYKANLQNLSPDELLHMGDDQLKDIGLSLSAIQQLRSIMSKLHSNGINCLSRSDGMFQHESSGSRRRYYNSSDNKTVGPVIQGPPPGTMAYGYVVPCSYSNSTNNSASNGCTFSKVSKRNQHIQLTNQVRALQLEDDSRRPCSNSSSTSDCSSGSHSPPETPSLPLISEAPPDHFDRGYSGKDSGAESWNSATSEEKVREDRLHDGERVTDDRTHGPSFQPPGIQRNSVNSRSRGLSKAPPGIPTLPRGRGHPMVDKNRREPVSPMNGLPAEMSTPPPPYAMSAASASGMPSNVAYPAPPASSFLPPFTSMHAFRYQPNSFLPTGSPYPFHPYPHPPQPTPSFSSTPVVAFSPAHPPPKLSCYNCGRQGHQGSDCKESTFEEITQQGQYHLDYKPGDYRETEK